VDEATAAEEEEAMSIEPFNPLAPEDDAFDEPAEDTDFLPIAVIDVARQDERKKLIEAMQAKYREERNRLIERGVAPRDAIYLAAESVLFGMDWVTAPTVPVGTQL
jgi:hypothetical protein